MTVLQLSRKKIYPDPNSDLHKQKTRFLNAIDKNDYYYIRTVLRQSDNKKYFVSDEFLYKATINNNLPITRLLLDNGANPNGLNGGILIEATAPGRANLLQILLNNGGTVNIHDGLLLTTAVRQKNTDLVFKLLNNGANPNINNGVALVEAAKTGNYKIINLLCRYKANPNINESDALKQAESKGHRKAMMSLLYYGADENVLKKDKNQELVRLVYRVKHNSVQEFEPKFFLCIPYKSQQQKDYEYLHELNQSACPSLNNRRMAISF